jgi:hypothetical protein
MQKNTTIELDSMLVIDAEIARMETQFNPEVQPHAFDLNTVIAVGGVAVESALAAESALENVASKWVAVGRARIPGNAYQDTRSLTEALNADLHRKAQVAGFSNYTLDYTAAARQRMQNDEVRMRIQEDEKTDSKKKKKNRRSRDSLAA